MWIRTIATAAVSILLSVTCTLLLIRHEAGKAGEFVRTQAIELVDRKGNIRATLKLADWYNGEALQPELRLLNEQGDPGAVLDLDPSGHGVLSFNSYDPDNFHEGIVTVGYLRFDDTTVKEDPLGAWGLRVVNSKRAVNTIGIRNSGQLLNISAPPPVIAPPAAHP